MLLREKLKLTVPGKLSGKVCFSAIKASWRRILPMDPAQTGAKQASLAREVGAQGFSPELQGLIGTLNIVRLRILANTLLRGWTKWFVWVLAGLITVAVASTKLAGAVTLIVFLAVLGGSAILAWAWRTRLCTYDAARRLDSAAGLKDRVSTAIHHGELKDPGGIIGLQRKDALARLLHVDSRVFFPVRLPANVGPALALVLLAAGLFAYRIHHQPPLISLLQTTARSQLIQSIFSPIVDALEKDLQRTVALLTMKPEATGEETRRGDSASADNLWKASDDKGAGAEDQKDSADAGDLPQDQMQAPGDQEGSSSAEARSEDGESQTQEGKSGNEGASGKSQQQSEQQGAEGRQSLGQSLLQALKNMLSNSPNQQASNRANQQPPNGQGTPQSGNSHQPGSTESDKRGESRGSSDVKQKATQTASEGAGSQLGNKELRKDQEARPVNAVPDRVALEASGFKDQTRMNLAAETGVAQMPVRDQSPSAATAINGAEQEDIPARYRFYVQRYFGHEENGNH